MKAGIIVMVSKDEMTTQEAEDRYHKRDCVEKAFEALKSHLGMDKIGVTTEGAMHGKGGYLVRCVHPAGVTVSWHS